MLATSGLGSSKSIRELEITWPSGLHQVLHNIAADRVVILSEKDATVLVLSPKLAPATKTRSAFSEM